MHCVRKKEKTIQKTENHTAHDTAYDSVRLPRIYVQDVLINYRLINYARLVLVKL